MVNMQLLVRGNETKAVEVDNQLRVAQLKVNFSSFKFFLMFQMKIIFVFVLF